MSNAYIDGLTYFQYDFKRIFGTQILQQGTPIIWIKHDGRGEYLVMVDDREFTEHPSMRLAESLVEQLEQAVDLILQ